MKAAESRIAVLFASFAAFTWKVNQKRAVTLVKCIWQEHKNQRRQLFMSIITTTSLESNKRIKINFKGGDLSSDVLEPHGWSFPAPARSDLWFLNLMSAVDNGISAPIFNAGYRSVRKSENWKLILYLIHESGSLPVQKLLRQNNRPPNVLLQHLPHPISFLYYWWVFHIVQCS